MHGALLLALIIGFAAAPKFDDATESIPVATVTQEQFNQIMNGERDATPMKEPPPAPSHSAATPAPPPPTPPTPPTPPPELKTAEETPPTPPPPPPPRPEEPKAAPPPKPLADDASSPPPPPPKRLAEDMPSPPVRPRTPPPEKPKADPLAKLLEKAKTGKTEEPRPQKAYDPNAIAKLIGDTKSSPEPSTNSATPLGLPTQHAARMSPSLAAGLDAWLTEAYLNCWTPPPTMPEGERYVAEVRVAFNADGTLAAQPTLVNPPVDPAWRAHAESAVRAVLKCNPLRVPPQYAPYFEQWRTKTVHFDPQSALG